MTSTSASPVENLVEFIKLRRGRMGLGHNALARASGIDPGSLANLMVGRVKRAPTLSTLQKLAVGLQVDSDVLIRIASGLALDLEKAATVSHVSASPASSPNPGDPSRSAGRFPLTQNEREVLKAAAAVGIQWNLENHPEILEIAPPDRKWIFRDLESVLHSIDLHKRLQPPI